jgi:hypothetical protein
MTQREFNREITDFNTRFRAYWRQMGNDSLANTDCVGTTIDDLSGTSQCP